MKNKRTHFTIIALGLTFVAIYCFKVGVQNADMQQALTLLGSAAGIVTSLQLGYYAVILDDKLMGKLADKRLSIFSGAFALAWIAVHLAVSVLGKGS